MRGLGVFVLLLLIPVFGFAQEPASTQELLLKLQQRLDSQEEELKRLRAEQQELRQQLAARPAAEATAPPDVAPSTSRAQQTPSPQPIPASPKVAAQSATTSDAPWWRSDKLHIGGYGSFRFEAGDAPGQASSFTFRRFVTTTDARLTDRLRVYSEFELERLVELELEKGAERTAGGVKFESEVEGNAGAEISLEQLWAQYDLGKGQAIRGGLILPPLGRFNLLHDDDYWDIARRTLIDRSVPAIPVAAAWRELGVGLVGAVDVGETGKLQYQAYVMNGAALDFNIENIVQTRTPSRNKLELEAALGMASGAANGTQNSEAFGWRVAYSPTLAGELAVSGYSGKYTPSFIASNERVHSIAADGKWRFGSFEIEGEYVYSDFGKTERVAQSLAEAVNVSASETSSGETADLENEIEIELAGLAKRRWGFWFDAKYHWRPDWLKKSFLGRGFEDPQLIPIVRYERVWLDRHIDELAFDAGVITDLVTQNLSQDRFTIGFNYRPTLQFGFQMAYERNNRREGDRLLFPDTDADNTNGLLMGWTFSF
ncbi:MAG TPA: hypothetical protein VLA96_03990 [Terriglobales bacterium]|nr:hypothetical protein [Terriglobales bacterium]